MSTQFISEERLKLFHEAQGVITLALNSNNEKVSVYSVTDKSADYRCPYCSQKLKVSESPLRFSHLGKSCSASKEVKELSKIPFVDTSEILNKKEREFIARIKIDKGKVKDVDGLKYELIQANMIEPKNYSVTPNCLTRFIHVHEEEARSVYQRLTENIKENGSVLFEGNNINYELAHEIERLYKNFKLIEKWDKEETVKLTDKFALAKNHLIKIDKFKSFLSSYNFFIESKYLRLYLYNNIVLDEYENKIKRLNDLKLYVFSFDVQEKSKKFYHKILKLVATHKEEKDALSSCMSELKEDRRFSNVRKPLTYFKSNQLGRFKAVLDLYLHENELTVASHAQFHELLDILRKVDKLDRSKFQFNLKKTKTLKDFQIAEAKKNPLKLDNIEPYNLVDGEASMSSKGGFSKSSDIEYLKRYRFIVKRLRDGETIREIASHYDKLRDPKSNTTNNVPNSLTPSYSTIGKVSRIYKKQLKLNPYFILNELRLMEEDNREETQVDFVDQQLEEVV